MKTQLDCIPCFIRQALEAARHAEADETIQKMVLRRVCRWVSDMDMAMTPPMMGQRMHRLVRELTGNTDPYAECKSNFNRGVLELLPELRQEIASSPDPFATAVRLAIAGNAIDMGANSQLDNGNLRPTLVRAMASPVIGALEALRAAIRTANKILYIADNAGEIVLDRLLIEQIGAPRITVVVRGQAVLNDATLADATAAGLNDLVEIIDNGSDAPGTLLSDCTAEMQHRFAHADVVLAKGQGNYETLSAVTRPNVFFLLMAKCPVIAEHIGCERNSLIVAPAQAPRTAPKLHSSATINAIENMAHAVSRH
ncbi:MAG: damage-control phosphatase ARMT1 family protein [Phycisphaerae bacterium]